jgi:polar amino acid transport system permease protein
MILDWGVLWKYEAEIIEGMRITLEVSAWSILFSTVLGLIIGSLRVFPVFFLNKILNLYVEIMRNVPAVVKLFLIHFVLGLDAFLAGVVALSLHQSAYIADVVSAGLQALPKGQLEAALSTGLSYRHAFMRILLPQALRITIPPMTTQFVQVVKNSSIVMLISLQDLTFVTNQIEHETFRGMEASIAVTVIYLLIAFSIIAVMNMVQSVTSRRFK